MVTTALTQELTQPLDAFAADTRAREWADEPFANETARTLRIEVDGGVWLKPGAAIAYNGDLTFERRPTLGAASIEDAVLRETAPLVRASGRGRLYCADRGAHVRCIRLSGEQLVVSWQDLLAFEESLEFESSLVGHGVGIAAGGLVAVTLSGHGALAVLTHGRPITLTVEPGSPVYTDPHATLAWSAGLTPTLKTDLSWRSAFAHGGHEPFQMAFAGAGFVVVQAYEDASRIHLTQPLKKIAKLVTG
jgi:uncharacterized protein (AIM24 family)